MARRVIATAAVNVDANTGSAEASLNDLVRSFRRVSRDAERAAASMYGIGRQARRADRSLDRMSGVTRRMSGDVRGLIGLLGAAGLGYAMTSVTRFGLDMTQQLEKSEAAFLGLTGSMEGANRMLDTMVEFARETPYNLANVTQAAAQLLAVGDGFGVTADNVDEYLTTFGNALTITGGSEDQFIRIVRVLGQMSSTGKVLGQDMNQLAQNLPGFNVWQTLADGAGVSVQELRRLQDIGQLDELLTGDEAVRILIDGMEDIPGAAGAMERRMNTLGGAIEKFKETSQLALSEGLEPFSETAQDVLKDPVILRSVEELGDAFGGLLSSGLSAIAPELDDLAASGAAFLGALESWAPVFAEIVDALGDFLRFISPLVDGLGQLLGEVLGLELGLGKLAAAAALFAAGGPLGIAGGILFGVSGAMSALSSNSENLAGLQRLLAAAQRDVNDAMSEGEDVIYSEAQQLAIDTAEQLQQTFPELAAAMGDYGVTVEELRTSMLALQEGTGTLTPELQALQAAYQAMAESGQKGVTEDSYLGASVIAQLEAYGDIVEATTKTLEDETQKQIDVLSIAGIEEIAAAENRVEAWEYQAQQQNEYYRQMAIAEEARVEVAAEAAAKQIELSDEQTEKITSLLQDQIDAYVDWEKSINESTDGAALSFSSVAEEAENSVSKIIDAIKQNTLDTATWKNNIVAAAVGIQESLGVTDEEAQEFMRTLGEMGLAAAPAVQEMLDDFENGGTQLQDFFDAVTVNSDVMSSSLTDAFDEATGAVPTLAKALADDTVTIEEVLAALPEAMEAAGLDMEGAAELIELADEFDDIGESAVAGLVNALNAGRSRVRVAASQLAAQADVGARQGLNVRSPSRVMAEIGEFAVEGLIVGFQSMSDESYAAAVLAAEIMASGVEDHFRDADDPQKAARDFARDVADTIVDELISEQEAVANAAEELAQAAADRLGDAWDRVRDRFRDRDIREGVAEARAELTEARAELRAAEALAGAQGARARSRAEQRVQAAQSALAIAEAADQEADLLADRTLTAFRRGTEDAVEALKQQQESEREALRSRIDLATRNLDPVARAAAEAELDAALERHDAEMTALERRREDEEDALRVRLDNENRIREESIRAKQDELRSFERALDEVVKSIASAVENLPGLRGGIGEAERDLQEAFFDQFERLLENAATADTDLLRSVGARAGLSSGEVNSLINAARAAVAADAGAAAAAAGVDQLMSALTSGVGILSGAVGRLVGAVNGGYAIPTSSQLVDVREGAVGASSSLITMNDTVIQDATDADLVAQQLVVALGLTGLGS